jgi:tetrahydromethanopterin S-methyltransferase subunit E
MTTIDGYNIGVSYWAFLGFCNPRVWLAHDTAPTHYRSVLGFSYVHFGCMLLFTAGVILLYVPFLGICLWVVWGTVVYMASSSTGQPGFGGG